ncbi:hypothetical protein [Luethyella okanaganae]|uniref:Uncharacterized protein n=1 Tax=Luethyella okanaganae TaxID=69372 RepID=A0ABW1VCU1_9MICO
MSIPRVLLIALAAFVVGALLATGVAALARSLTDDSRPSITLADVVRDDLPGFANASAPTADACGDRRGCVEGVVGDGVVIYRYQSLDLARQSVIYSDADFYRSDRLVIEFEDALTPDERFQLLQVVEGTWTASSD